MKSFGYLNSSKGAVAPLVAIMLVVIIVCVAVVVDLGHIHNVKLQLQRAVDAAALAGANELDGSAGAVQRAKDAAEGAAYANLVDQENVIIVADNLTDPDDATSSHFVEVGTWDDQALGQPASIRFVPDETLPDAVKVTATRTVDHLFFFFVPSTTVMADAIAVAKPKVPVLPLAIITCIPAERMLENPGALPTANVCGIAAFSFVNDQDDTAAWSSLTFNASASEIVELMSTEEGAVKFNKVVFGTGLKNEGIENESVDPGIFPFNVDYDGCPDNSGSFPNGFNINCGLGQVGTEKLASPSEFDPKKDPGFLSSTHGEPAPNGFDPLTDYGRDDGALPRWYNLNNKDTSFDKDDHFTRVWSQDRILVPWGSDFDANGKLYAGSPYFNRLQDLAEGTYKPYGDDRFVLGFGNLIIQPKDQLAKNLEAALGFTPLYWPDFLEVMKYAGYPKVGVINGDAATVLQAFVDNENVSDGTNLKCSNNHPFPEGEKTLRVNAPVIFAGACENWQAISNPSNHSFRYIGMSKVLLTRVWTNQLDYDCGENFVQWTSGNGCDVSDFDPPLNGDYFSLPVVTNPNNLKAIEGLTLVPVADDEEDQGSLLKVYLVE